MARPGTKAAKKRDPRRAEEWPVEKYPIVIHKRYGEPVYQASVKAARDWVIKDIGKFRTQFEQLGHADVVEHCDVLIEQARRIDEGLEYSTLVAGVIDPMTRLRYEATVTRRTR